MTSPKKNEKIEKELSNNITNSKEDIGNIENLNHLNTNDYINHQATIRNNSNPVCWFCNNNISCREKTWFGISVFIMCGENEMFPNVLIN